jgi:very-short-patch-repair endonuclease
MLAIEIDGDSHNEKEKYDKLRQKELEQLGITILKFDGHSVLKNSQGVLQTIYNWIEVYEKTHP